MVLCSFLSKVGSLRVYMDEWIRGDEGRGTRVRWLTGC